MQHALERAGLTWAPDPAVPSTAAFVAKHTFAEGTRKQHACVIAAYKRFCARSRRAHDPIRAAQVSNYVYALHLRGLKASTIRAHAQVLSTLAGIHGHPWDEHGRSIVKATLRAVAAVDERVTKRPTALTLPMMAALEKLAHPRSARDRQVLDVVALGVSFGARFSTLRDLKVHHVAGVVSHAGQRGVKITLPRTKTTRSSPDRDVVVLFPAASCPGRCPVRVVQRLVRVHGKRGTVRPANEPLFTHVLHGPKPMTYHAFSAALRSITERSQDPAVRAIRTHSMRAGTATMLMEQGAPEYVIARVCRWANGVPQSYLRLNATTWQRVRAMLDGGATNRTTGPVRAPGVKRVRFADECGSSKSSSSRRRPKRRRQHG